MLLTLSMRRSLAALVLALLLPLPAMAAERHVVKPGETLSQIAERYGVSTSRLMQLNGIKSADLIQTGTSLRLPAARAAAGSASGRGTYRVKPGETLSEIAERSGISVRRLMDLNNLSRADHVEAGRLLVVPGAVASRPAAVNKGASEHVVRPGETLSGIAELYGVPVSRLVSLNAITSPDNVEAGSRLALRSPAAAAKPAAAKPAAAKPAPAKPATPAPTTPAPTTPATATTTTAATGGPPDWRTYGPIQVDFTTWQPLGGSRVASALNNQGQQLFLAVNCSAKKINTTGEGGVWKSWAPPQADFEERLIVDAC